MATAEATANILPMDMTGGAHELSVRWKKWCRSFEFYAEGHDISDGKRLRSLLLHHAGQGVQDIYETLPEPDAVAAGQPARTEFETAKLKLDTYFKYEPNTAFERHTFRLMRQRSWETVSQFLQQLRQQAAFCSFTANIQDEYLRDQLVEGVQADTLRKKLLDKRGLTLATAQEIARQHETTEASARGMSAQSSEVHQVSSFRPVPAPCARGPRGVSASSDQKDCSNCGRRGHKAGDARCPAMNQKCHECGRSGRFVGKCRSASATPGATPDRS